MSAPVIASTWVRVCAVEDVPLLEGRAVSIDDRRLAVFRLPDGVWAASDAACPHKGGPLQDGIVADRCVTCPLHQKRYDLLDPAGELRTYRAEARDGAVWVQLP